MSNGDYETLQLVGHHVEEPWNGVGPNPHDTADPVTGLYEVGVLIQGVFRPLAQFKAPHLFKDIAREQKAQESAAAAPPPSEPPAQ